MKIVCDNCSAKYQISDDKVRNKTFKIRCKKCSHIIVVRAGEQDAPAAASEPAVAAQEPAAAEPAAAPQAAPDAIWHVVINREQVGPLSPSQVEGYFQSGDIDIETFIWAEGMADWSRLGSVPQFAHLAPAPAASPAPAAAAAAAAAPAAAAAAEPAPSGGGMFPSEDDDVIASNNVADATARAPSSMFPDEEEPANPRISTASQLRNQRNENSVLFSLDTLAAEAENRRAKPAAAASANTGGSEASGLIDITALGGLDVGGARSGDDPFGGSGGMAPAPLTAAAPVQPLVTAPSRSKTGLIVAIVLGVLLLIGGAVTAMYFVMKKDDGGEAVATAGETTAAKVTMGNTPPEKPAAAAAPEKPAADEKAAESPEGTDDEGGEDGADDDGKEGGDEAEAGDDKPEAAARRAPARRTRRTTRRTTPKQETAAAPAAREAPKPEPARRAPARPKKESTSEVDALLGALDGPGGGSKPAAGGTRPSGGATPAPSGGDPMLPEQLDRRQILTVVKRNARSIQGCKAGSDASGNVIVEMVIGKSGRVTSATTQGAHSGTPVGSCVERKVRAFRFPQFSGDSMRIKMPFAL